MPNGNVWPKARGTCGLGMTLKDGPEETLVENLVW